jgi:hypothetical protein
MISALLQILSERGVAVEILLAAAFGMMRAKTN